MLNIDNGNGVDTALATDPTPTAPAPEPKAKRPKAKAKPAAKKAAPKKAKSAQPKAKAKPRQANPDTVDEFGLRKGSIKSKAAAMYASAKGATLAEVKAKLGSIQYNVLKQLRDKGFKVTETEEVNKKTGRKASRFNLKPKK